MNKLFQYQRLILGYHGCDQSVADHVLLKKKSLESSENDYDWLGKGIYFWEHGPERALEWAEQQKQLSKIKSPAVVGAVIHLGTCFDLLDRQSTKALRLAFPRFCEEMANQKQNIPENAPAHGADTDMLLRKRDCAVLNWLLDLKEHSPGLDACDSVRGLFQEDEPVYKGSAIRLKSHIQIAIRNPACILGYFSPS